MCKNCKFTAPLPCCVILAIFFKIGSKIRVYQNLHNQYTENNNLHFCVTFCANDFCGGLGAII